MKRHLWLPSFLIIGYDPQEILELVDDEVDAVRAGRRT